MLHRSVSDGLICMTQPAHAWVSGQLAQAWGNQAFGDFSPHTEVCLGAEQHDIGWLTWEQNPTLNPETGYPRNFMQVPVATHVQLWSEAKQFALPLGRYVALLVSLHGTGLYERFRSWEQSPENRPIVEKFLQQESVFQQSLIASLQEHPDYVPYTTPAAIQRNRQLVATWDSFSLMICMGLDAEKPLEGVPTADGETTLMLTPLDGDMLKVKVSPWPFQLNSVRLVYEGRLLQEKFTDEAQMQAALAAAPWVALSTTLVRD